MVIQHRTNTAKEFWELVQETADNSLLELIEGMLIEMPPSSPQNTVIAARILAFLFNFVEQHVLGYVSGADGAIRFRQRQS